MKNLIRNFSILCFFLFVNKLLAQDFDAATSPLFDRAEAQLSNSDTIPDYRSQTKKLKLTGVVYQSDGVTPAKDVIIYIEQADENGNFDLRKEGDERYVFHRSWVKTDEEGRYTFYTFVPGNDRRYNQLQQIYPLVKEPSKDVYAIDTFLFDEDPLLTKSCRKRISKKGDPNRILKLENKDGLLVAQHNIVLSAS
ncbi:MAG: hypothetical protein CL868_02025 [Cytophagaceae bacterium]|nr:hypothetical protein [Flavobacteriaceae bacterium]MAZ25840.1 hypothetical protein [Cytophagaceae bacterium]